MKNQREIEFQKFLSDQISENRITESQSEQIQRKIHFTIEFDQLADVDLVYALRLIICMYF
jgi:3-hydroxyacyl-CoA dehydrogenase